MPRTLLLADDSITMQKVVAITVAHEDFNVVTVDNGEDALAKARELKPAIVVADVVMPGMSGYDVCEALKADPATRHVPVLLLAGTFEAFDEERARQVQADGHISKPFESGAFLEVVRRLAGEGATPSERQPPSAPPPVSTSAPAIPSIPIPEGIRPLPPLPPPPPASPGAAEAAPASRPSWSLPPSPPSAAAAWPPPPPPGTSAGVFGDVLEPTPGPFGGAREPSEGLFGGDAGGPTSKAPSPLPPAAMEATPGPFRAPASPPEPASFRASPAAGGSPEGLFGAISDEASTFLEPEPPAASPTPFDELLHTPQVAIELPDLGAFDLDEDPAVPTAATLPSASAGPPAGRSVLAAPVVSAGPPAGRSVLAAPVVSAGPAAGPPVPAGATTSRDAGWALPRAEATPSAPIIADEDFVDGIPEIDLSAGPEFAASFEGEDGAVSEQPPVGAVGDGDFDAVIDLEEEILVDDPWSLDEPEAAAHRRHVGDAPFAGSSRPQPPPPSVSFSPSMAPVASSIEASLGAAASPPAAAASVQAPSAAASFAAPMSPLAVETSLQSPSNEASFGAAASPPAAGASAQAPSAAASFAAPASPLSAEARSPAPSLASLFDAAEPTAPTEGAPAVKPSSPSVDLEALVEGASAEIVERIGWDVVPRLAEALLREQVAAASRDVIEKVVWEVVPQLAETILRSELDRLVRERRVSGV